MPLFRPQQGPPPTPYGLADERYKLQDERPTYGFEGVAQGTRNLSAWLKQVTEAGESWSKQQARQRAAETQQLQQLEQARSRQQALERAKEEREGRSETREQIAHGAGLFQHAAGALPFVGGLSRIISAGLVGGAKNDQRAAAQEKSTPGDSKKEQRATAQEKPAAASDVAARVRDSGAEIRSAASAQRDAGRQAGRASEAQTKAGKSAETAMSGGGAVFSKGHAVLQTIAEVSKFAIGGIGKASPATMERLNYQTDRLQAAFGALLVPAARNAGTWLERLTDNLAGKGFQLAQPQYSDFGEIQKRIQIEALREVAPQLDDKSLLGQAQNVYGGEISRIQDNGLGSYVGDAVNDLAYLVKDEARNSWVGRQVDRGYRGVMSIFD